MSFFSLVGMEWRKMRRSKILGIFLLGVILLWIPSVLHADLNFHMEAEGISPENSFFIQGFLAMVWFLFPATMVVVTVMQNQMEKSHGGLLKMLALPADPALLCLAKFAVLVFFSAIFILMAVGGYYVSAALVSRTQNYGFSLPLGFVLREAAMMWASGIPMLAVFWLLAVCIRTPIFSVGLGLASIVPSILLINTKLWFLYPMAYPFFVLTAEYGKLAANLSMAQVRWFPWLPVAAFLTAACIAVSCLRFGQTERR